MKYFLFFLILTLFTSCAYHSGLITSPTVDKNKKITYTDIAIGYSSATYIFGIGGNAKDVLVNEAKQNLLFSYPLQPGQYFENITLNNKMTIIFPFSRLETIMVADVVESDTSFSVSYSQKYKDFINKSNPYSANQFFKLNDEVSFFSFGDKNDQNMLVGKVAKLKKSKAVVFYVDSDGLFKVKAINYNNLFKSNQANNLSETGIQIGDTVSFLEEIPGKLSTQIGGFVLMMNENYAYIHTPQGRKRVRLSRLSKISN